MKVYLEHRIQTFVQLGKIMDLLAQNSPWPGYDCGLTEEEYHVVQAAVDACKTYNGWFTETEIRRSLAAWASELQTDKLHAWLNGYSENNHPKKVAIICAGNIPAVGFHDVLSVLITGNYAIIKLSTDDPILIPAMLTIASRFEPELPQHFEYATGKLQHFDAVIATGSNATSVHFKNYFEKYPNIIRKNRNSVAVLDGSETKEELEALGHDIFDYFGLGCRNVTKLYLPQDFDLDRIFEAIYPFKELANHNKFANNYDYNKAIWLLNNEDLIENGFVLFKQDENIASPVGSVFYERYTHIDEVKQVLEAKKESIQCVVGHGYLPFGSAQCPTLTDYADGVDTLAFLKGLQG